MGVGDGGAGVGGRECEVVSRKRLIIYSLFDVICFAFYLCLLSCISPIFILFLCLFPFRFRSFEGKITGAIKAVKEYKKDHDARENGEASEGERKLPKQ